MEAELDVLAVDNCIQYKDKQHQWLIKDYKIHT